MELWYKLVVFPLSTDLANDKDFCAALSAFFFQVALREFFFDFDVRFLGTAIISTYFKKCKILNKYIDSIREIQGKIK